MNIVHDYNITPTGDSGMNSGRPRYRVVCTTCNEVLHENTTSPEAQQQRHEEAPMSTDNLDWIRKENHPDNGGLDSRNQHLQYMLLAALDLLADDVDSPGSPDSARDVSYQIGLARARGVLAGRLIPVAHVAQFGNIVVTAPDGSHHANFHVDREHAAEVVEGLNDALREAAGQQVDVEVRRASGGRTGSPFCSPPREEVPPVSADVRRPWTREHARTVWHHEDPARPFFMLCGRSIGGAPYVSARPPLPPEGSVCPVCREKL